MAGSRAITLADCASTWWRRALVEWTGLLAARAAQVLGRLLSLRR
jgi:hypothetical protein